MMLVLAWLLAVGNPDLVLRQQIVQGWESGLVYRSTAHREHPTHVRHCRNAPGGCVARLRTFANFVVDAAHARGLDPWTLAAMAYAESRLNPGATGRVGERGILQIHPRTPWGRKLKFVRDSRYRERCVKTLGGCQRDVVESAATVLAHATARCGNEAEALGAYNLGRCSETSYTRRVYRHRRALKIGAGLLPPPKATN